MSKRKVMDRLDEIQARADADPHATWEVFRGRFKEFDGYRSEAKQHDLWTVFRSGIQYSEQRADVPALVAALRAVLNLHSELYHDGPRCTECVYLEGDDPEPEFYPCPTVRAIEAALGEAS